MKEDSHILAEQPGSLTHLKIQSLSNISMALRAVFSSERNSTKHCGKKSKFVFTLAATQN